MGLRAKLAATFIMFLVLAVLLSSALEIDHTMRLMVDDLGHHGTLLIHQTFEQIRAIVNRSTGDRVAALRQDPGLVALLESSRAFSKGIVYAKIETPTGAPILAVPDEAEAPNAAVVTFATLQQEAASWWPATAAEPLWSGRTYEISRTVEIDGQPFVMIKVGLSTALMASAIRRAIMVIAAIGATAIALSLLGATVLGGVLLRPVAKIATSLEQLTAGREAPAVQVAGNDELSMLAEKFNELSQRIISDRAEWESERGQFFKVFYSITDALLLLDAGGMVLFANDEARARLGLAAGVLTDRKPLALLLGKEHPLSQLVETVYATRNEVRDVALEIGGGTEPVPLLASVLSLGRGREGAGLLVIARDMEPVKELENVVDYSGRLARLGGLISGVAHQIRNPLNAMNLQLELLVADAARREYDSLGRRVEAVRKEIRRLDEVVDALMRFMRPEQMKLSRVTLNELLTEVVAQVMRPGVNVDYQFDPKVKWVRADRALLREALSNIAHNAVEAMPQGGTVTIATALRPEGFVEVAVRDQGVGIPAEKLGEIFQLYFTTKPNGNGVGLPLAVRAIDLHHGTVDVESKVGAGTTVKVRLPLKGESPAPLPSAAGAN